MNRDVGGYICGMIGIFLVPDLCLTHTDVRYIVQKGHSALVSLKFSQNPHTKVKSADLLVYQIQFLLHIKNFGVGKLYYFILVGIMDKLAYFLNAAAGLSHCMDKEKRTDLRRRIIMITVIGINPWTDYVLFVIKS